MMVNMELIREQTHSKGSRLSSVSLDLWHLPLTLVDRNRPRQTKRYLYPCTNGLISKFILPFYGSIGMVISLKYRSFIATSSKHSIRTFGKNGKLSILIIQPSRGALDTIKPHHREVHILESHRNFTSIFRRLKSHHHSSTAICQSFFQIDIFE
jgi:hypothetical protein